MDWGRHRPDPDVANERIDSAGSHSIPDVVRIAREVAAMGPEFAYDFAGSDCSHPALGDTKPVARWTNVRPYRDEISERHSAKISLSTRTQQPEAFRGCIFLTQPEEYRDDF